MKRRLPPSTIPALALVALLALGTIARAVVDPVGKVTEIQVTGNTSITTDQVLGTLRSKVNRDLDPKVVRGDVDRLLAKKWFSDVRTGYRDDPKRGGFVLVFTVQEMPVLRAVEFRGAKAIKVKDLEENTGLKVGQHADFVVVQTKVNQIKRLYEEKGYEFAQVTLVEGGKPGETRAIYQIFEGPKCQLHSVDFAGNVFSSDSILRSKITSRPPIAFGLGGKYRAEEIDEDARKLRDYYASQGFFLAKVTPAKRQGPRVGELDVTFVVSEGPQYKVREIAFEGNEKIATAKLREGLLMHSGKPYTDSLRDADKKLIESKYGAIGCIDLEIAPEPRVRDEPGQVDLVYQIKEGEQYLMGRLIMLGNDRTRDKVLRREATMAGLVPGEPLDANRIKLYEKRLNNLGYFQVNPQLGKPTEVKLVNRRPGSKPYGDPRGQADIREILQTRLQSDDDDPKAPAPLVVPPVDEAPRPGFGGGSGGGPILEPPADLPPIAAPVPEQPQPAPAPRPGRVNRRGVNPDANNAPLGAGEPPGTFPSIPGMNTTDVGPDRNEPFANRSYADIATSVDEKATGSLLFGVGANSYGGISGNIIVHESNFDLFAVPKSWRELLSGQAFRGAGQDLRIELSPGTLINRATISFRDPYVFNLPVAFGISAYAFQRVYSDYTEGRTGARTSLGKQFGTSIYADVAARIEDVNFHSYRVPAPASYLAASGHTTLFTLRPSVRYDNRNDPFSPNKGQYVEAAFEQGYGDFTFPKFTVEGRQYIPTGSRADGTGKRFFTLRGFYGITGRDTPVYERFYAGDFRSMRGFSYRGVGPRELGVNVGGLMTAIGSVEYQFPLLANDKLQQVVFCDFGTVESGYNFSTFRAAVGTGLRVYLPQQLLGPLPLAFDLAFPVAKEEGDRTRFFTFFIGAFW